MSTNIEIFYMSGKEMRSYGKESCWYDHDDKSWYKPGWYYWYCFPGCLPDSEPFGPFASESAAREDAEDID